MCEEQFVLITSGTGSHPAYGLCAFDQALHTGDRSGGGGGVAAVNIHRGRGRGAGLPGLGTDDVTSVLARDTTVCRMNRDAPEFPVDVEGAHFPAVLRTAYATGEEVITAGVGVGYVPGQGGVIYHHGGQMEGPECAAALLEMVTFGMNDVRSKDEWGFYCDTATSYPVRGEVGLARNAAALLIFLTPDDVKRWYEPVIVPAELKPGPMW